MLQGNVMKTTEKFESLADELYELLQQTSHGPTIPDSHSELKKETEDARNINR